MCLSLCLALVSCGGEKNPYQTFLKSNGSKTYPVILGESDNYPLDTVKDYQRRTGTIETSTTGKLYIDVEDSVIVPRVYGGDAPTVDYRLNRSVIIQYDMRDTVLKVRVFRYAYDCDSLQIDEDDYKWTDGFALNADRQNTVDFELDITKYFENGELTASDITSGLDIDPARVSTDTVDAVNSQKYTERNPEWEAKVITDVLEIVNELLGEFDDIVEGKNA